MTLQEQKRMLEELGKDPKYLLLNKYVQPMMDALQHQIFNTPSPTLDSCLGQEYDKGKLKGLIEWEEIRKTTIQTLTVEIKLEEENEAKDKPEQDNGVERGRDNQPSNAP